ncbi:hypothetical protein L0P88_21000 [Muricauda sp. SCSIO 64092]|uniref:hypothetical protein n=1 Tax=Allomuricauda sp. SCSIO 64092 TaxID=2908842 RepID=UPI00131B41D5|nr:hypothetical protein [Muricauda sp. SCSIO 64092]UOY06387.1 hypothetical protein L0P88_21000 [Muricauda sp. SCSIO 64092]
MNNLKSLNVTELTEEDLNHTNGGGLIGFAVGAFFLGRRIEYMKDGGGFFDFYL